MNTTTIGELAGNTFLRSSNNDVYIHRSDGRIIFYCTAATFDYTIAGQHFLGNSAPLEAAQGMINGIVARSERKG